MVPLSGEESTPLGRSMSFGPVAEAYERYCLGYPDEVVSAALQHAARPVRSGLEVGAGTGKATRLFASRGVDVTALEPDTRMAGVLRETTAGLPVTPVVTSFEDYAPIGCFDLVYAAAAWHWLDPATRTVRAVELLSPGGVLALFRISAEPADPGLFAAIDEIENETLPDDDPAIVHPWSLEDLETADGFADIKQFEFPRVMTRSVEEVVGRLATVSAYLMLSAKVRTDTLRRIRAVLPDQLELDITVQLSLARRA